MTKKPSAPRVLTVVNEQPDSRGIVGTTFVVTLPGAAVQQSAFSESMDPRDRGCWRVTG
jgi:hypothetical protein